MEKEREILNEFWKGHDVILDSSFVEEVILPAMREFHKQKLIELEDDGMIKVYFKIQ